MDQVRTTGERALRDLSELIDQLEDPPASMIDARDRLKANLAAYPLLAPIHNAEEMWRSKCIQQKNEIRELRESLASEKSIRNSRTAQLNNAFKENNALTRENEGLTATFWKLQAENEALKEVSSEAKRAMVMVDRAKAKKKAYEDRKRERKSSPEQPPPAYEPRAAFPIPPGYYD